LAREEEKKFAIAETRGLLSLSIIIVIKAACFETNANKQISLSPRVVFSRERTAPGYHAFAIGFVVLTKDDSASSR
jgi:hypothetical protein